jgi:hypothetical protein
LIVINMPLTQWNISLLKQEIFVNYLKAIENFGFEQGIPTFDLCDSRRFTIHDFHDSVHLNAFGGKKFFDRLVAVLAGDGRSASALVNAGREIPRSSLATSAKGGFD